MKLKDYVTYFKNLAISNKKIAHNLNGKKTFRRIDIEEVLTGLKQDVDGLSLFLENPEIKPYDALSDNPRQIYEGALLIMNSVEKGDFEEQENVLSESLEVCEQILAKIKNDVKACSMDASHPHKIHGFDFNSVRINKIGPVFGVFYGWRMTFSLNQTFNDKLVLKNTDWYNDTKFTI